MLDRHGVDGSNPLQPTLKASKLQINLLAIFVNGKGFGKGKGIVT